MVGEKHRSRYRKKSRGFKGVPKWCDLSEETLPTEDSSSSRRSPSSRDSSHGSASRKKLCDRGFQDEYSDSSGSSFETEGFEGHGYRLFDVNALSSTLSSAHKCDNGDFNLEENMSSRAGLMSEFSLVCSACGHSTSMKSSSSVMERGRSFDINRRAVYYSLEKGGGYEGLSSLCSIMNMPCISKTAYHKQVEIILKAQEDEAQAELTKAAEKLRQIIKDEECDQQEDKDIYDVAVSFDGTWAKRGFTSLIGVVFVMSVITGEVLDYHVLSKTCQKCALKKSQCEEAEMFEEWRIQHVGNGECDINFTGSSPAMEAEGAVILWNRSIERHNLRYKWMVSDGDSKAFVSVQDLYENCQVQKLDCVGHVQKRMGKHLLNLKARTKGPLKDGKSVGGKGRLTEAKIKQLQRYYGLAIRQNTLTKVNPSEAEVDAAVYKMKKNIIATLTHNVAGKDLASQHRYCPTGKDSWCKWQQDQATGTATYNGENCLPNVFLELLRPVFMTLSESKLLRRCVYGTTQNPNECINSLVWVRCPKHQFHGAKVVRFAVASAICHFHGGANSRENVMERLSIQPGVYTSQASKMKDRKRVLKSDRQVSAKHKKHRQGEQQRRTRREEALREAEGETYGAASFND